MKRFLCFSKNKFILDDILKKEFTKAPELNKIDNFVIENTTENKQNQDLIKNIIKRELYTDWNKTTFFSRKFIKKNILNLFILIHQFEILYLLHQFEIFN